MNIQWIRKMFSFIQCQKLRKRTGCWLLARNVLSIMPLNQHNIISALLSLYWGTWCWLNRGREIPTYISTAPRSWESLPQFRSVPYCQETHEKKSYNNKATYTPAQWEKMYFVEAPGQWHDHMGLLLQLCPVTEPPLSELSWGEPITQQGEQPPWSWMIPSRLQNQPEQDEQVKHEGNSTELYRTSLNTWAEILV